MTRRRWLAWCKQLLYGRPVPASRSRPRRGQLLALEELTPRWLPNATGPFPSALPLPLGGGPLAGTIAPAASYYEFSVTEPGRLTTELTPTGGAARLTLWAADGTVLLQSDGTSPADPTGRIDLHLSGSATGTTYYLGVQGLGGATGSYTLQASYAAATPPFRPLPVAGAIWGHPADLNGDAVPDMAVANFNSHEVFVLIGLGDGTFAPAATYTVGEGPNDVVAADLNGDHHLDLISANFDGSLSVLVGRGDGAFGSQTQLALGVNPSSIAAGDFDADGHTDLAVSDYGADEVLVLRGYGDARFADPKAYAVGAGPYELVAGDWDGDGRSDLAVANYNDSTMSILIGRAGGTFQPRGTVPVGTNPYGIAVADFNGDGRTDLATANYVTNDVTVLLGGGDGSFTTRTVPAGAGAYSVAAADFAGDGHADLAATNFTDGTISVLVGRGDGTFDPQRVLTVGSSPAMIVSADFNGDGRADLAHGDYNGSVSIGLGLGDATFRAVSQPAPGGGSYDLTGGDFDGDGRRDLAVVNYNTSDVQILLGRADGTFRIGGRFSTASDSGYVASADLNGDGALDLVVSNYSTSNVSVLLGRGDGTFGAPTLFATGNIPHKPVIADFNRDGAPDVATPDYGSGTVSILLGRGDGTFVGPLAIATGPQTGALAVGDFDGDGVPDLVAASIGSGDLSVLYGRGDGTFEPAVRVAAGADPSDVAVGDFDGDGTLDLASANYGAGTVSVFLGRSDGTFPTRSDFAVGYAPMRSRVADFNQDGRLDLALGSEEETFVEVYYGRGDGTFRAGGPVTVGGTVAAIEPGDFNGDGSPDLVTDNFSTGTVTTLLNYSGALAAPQNTPILAGPIAAAQGDVNHDGFTDFVSADYATGVVSVRFGQGNGALRDPATFAVGSGLTSIVLADGNRDGRLDVIVTNPSAGTVSILIGLGDGAFVAPRVFAAGTAPSALAAGDLNGDGFVDLAIADPGSNTVTVLLNNLHATPTRLQFAAGQGPEAVSINDIDGNGTPDIVVANSLSRDVTVLLGRGDGTFSALPAASVGTAPVAIATADVNGDGKTDVMTASRADGSVAILLGRGDGAFEPARRVAVGAAPAALDAGDFDGDGHTDLAVANSNGDAVVVLLGRGDGTFVAQAAVAVGYSPSGIVTGDFNNDGRLDFATANALDGTTVALGLGNGEFVEPGTDAPIQVPPLAADFNRDGIIDVVQLRKDGAVMFRPGRADGDTAFGSAVILNPGVDQAVRSMTTGVAGGTNVLFVAFARTNETSVYVWAGSAFVRVPVATLGTALPSTAIAGDVNGDGLDDLVIGSAATGDVFVGLQRPLEDFSNRDWDYRFNVGAGFTGLAIADMNADGRPDFVFTDPAAGTVGVVLNDATVPFSTQLRFRASDGLAAVPGMGAPRVESRDAPVALAAGRFDGDGTTDLAVLNRGTRQVTILHGDGRGGVFNPEASATLATGADPVSLVAGDFNRDGLADLAVLNRGSGDVSVFLHSAGGFVERLSLGADGRHARPGAGTSPNGIAVADVNRDGVPDLLVGGSEGDVLALMGNGDGTFRPYRRLDSRVTLAVSDQNRHGDFELALANRGTDRVTLLEAGTPVFQQDRTNGVQSPGAVMFADLNRDGLADLIVTSGGGNAVLVYAGVGGGAFATPRQFFVGTDPGAITVGDLNRDDCPDLMIVNEGSDDVSVLFGQGTGASWTMTNGPRLRAGAGPTDTVAQDVTGDGIVDILVANGESNTVYLLQGVGGGFFDDRRPVVFSTGARPVQLFVGNFDNQSGLDLVTVNAGSSDLTVFGGFGASRTVAVAGGGLVQAVAGDFAGAGSLGLLVASADGRFTLIQDGANGLGAARVFTSELTHVSDMGLARFSGGSIEVYVALDGQDVAVPVTLALNLPGPDVSNPEPGAPDGNVARESDFVRFTSPRDGDPGTPTTDPSSDSVPAPVTEFSAGTSIPIELIATLVLGDLGAGTTETGATDSASAADCTPMPDSAGEYELSDDAEPAVEGDVAADPAVRERNALITGAVDAPLLDYLAERPEAGPSAISFPSALDAFETRGDSRPATARSNGPKTELIVCEGGEAPVVATPSTVSSEGAAEPDESTAMEWLLRPEIFGTVLLTPALMYFVLGYLRARRPGLNLTPPETRDTEGVSCEEDGRIPS